MCSLDTFIVWRQWWMSGKEDWKPRTAGLHVDQNPFNKKGKHCIQGMIVLYDVNEQTGGLEVVPNTHTDEVQEELRARYPDASKHKKDWVKLSADDPYQKGMAKTVKLKAGDILLWDSRIVHGGSVGTGYNQFNNPLGPGDLARLAFTVSYSPKSLVKDKEILFKRRKTFLDGRCSLNHWAHEYVPNFLLGFGGKDIKFKMEDFKHPPETAQITSLLGMTQEEYEQIEKAKKSKKRNAARPLNDTNALKRHKKN